MDTVICLMIATYLTFASGMTDTLWRLNGTSERIGKWNLFNFKQLNREPCEGNQSQIGVCVTAKGCHRSGGQNIGTCAQGFGVCCFISRSCGETITENGTYFVNPNYPSAVENAGYCSVEIVKSSNNICQLRLDIDELHLAGIDSQRGRCISDSMLVVGKDSNNIIPPICGSNSGQHLYVEVGSSTGPFNLMVSMSSSETEVERKWKIRVTQIECNNPGKAPALCMQYHTGNVGAIKSFNQEIVRESEQSFPLHYAICFRKEIGMCALAFTGEFNSAFAENDQCQSEYLALGVAKYCADKSFDSEIRANGWGPVVATVKTERNRISFNLRYSQIACLNGL